MPPSPLARVVTTPPTCVRARRYLVPVICLRGWGIVAAVSAQATWEARWSCSARDDPQGAPPAPAAHAERRPPLPVVECERPSSFCRGVAAPC
eukprot:3013778-Prymnesium_polylepis.1